MKIACVSPYKLSSVGDVAERTSVEMQRAGHEVCLIGTGRAPFRETKIEVIRAGQFSRFSIDFMKQFDAVVYHAANDPSGSATFWLLEHVPGIVILHDRTYIHGYDGYTSQYLARPAQLEAIAERYYGAEGVEFVRRFRGWQAQPHEIDRFRFLEPVLENALAAVVHYQEYGDLIRSITNIPVLSSNRPAYPRSTRPIMRRDSAGGDGDFHLVYVGHVSPYRNLPLLFEVLHDRPDLLARTTLTIVGMVDDPGFAEGLQRTASELGVDHVVHWAFNATDDVKHEVLSTADAAFNCRSLNSEGLSGSLMEQMTYGLPVIVNSDGFAREAPADTVCFVRREELKSDVEQALEKLVYQPEYRQAVGESARLWAEATGSTKAYAEAILGLIASALNSTPMSLRGRARDLIYEIGDMPGSHSEQMINSKLTELFHPK